MNQLPTKADILQWIADHPGATAKRSCKKSHMRTCTHVHRKHTLHRKRMPHLGNIGTQQIATTAQGASKLEVKMGGQSDA